MGRPRSAKLLARTRRRGQKIADTPKAIKAKSSIRYLVKSQTAAKLLYIVTLGVAGIVCSCPGSQGGRQLCKHMAAVDVFMDRIFGASGDRTAIMRRIPKCRVCKSCSWTKNGHRYNKRTKVQRYKCKKCGFRPSGTDGFRGRHFGPRVIVRALSMVAGGMSPAEARQQMAMGKIFVHADTIRLWVAHYSELMDGYAATLRICAGFRWHVDEVYFKIRAQERFLFAVMDGASRFVLSYEISPTKFGFKPLQLFVRAADRAGRLPRILVSDGLNVFGPAARTAFARRSGPRFVHVAEIHIKKIFNQNNICERLNGEFKDRLSRIRGLKAEMPPIVRLMIVYHNFFRPHTGIGGRTPAMEAGIDIISGNGGDADSVPDEDTWITFIQNAALCTA